MRLTAPELAAAYSQGMASEGATVLDAGEVGTEMLYYLVGSRDLDGGLMCTASHNPRPIPGPSSSSAARSLCRATPDRRRTGHDERAWAIRPAADRWRTCRLYDEFHRYVTKFIDRATIKPMKVVVDGGNGMAGPMVGPILHDLGLD